MAGLPDIIVCYRGVFIGLETKTPEGHGPTKRQEYVHGRINDAEGVVAVVRSVHDALNVLYAVDASLNADEDAQAKLTMIECTIDSAIE